MFEGILPLLNHRLCSISMQNGVPMWMVNGRVWQLIPGLMSMCTHTLNFNNCFYCLNFTHSLSLQFRRPFVSSLDLWPYKMRQLYLISPSFRFLFPLLFILFHFIFQLCMATTRRGIIYYIIIWKWSQHDARLYFIPLGFVDISYIKVNAYVCQRKESHTWNCNTINTIVNVKMIKQCAFAHVVLSRFFPL